MGIITTMRRQRAAYWAPLVNPAGVDQYDAYGARRYEAPVEIRCRWENTKMEALSATDEKKQVNATVYVDRDVKVGGFLRLGTLDSVEFADDPRENDEVYEIRDFVKTPNLRNTEYLRKVTV